MSYTFGNISLQREQNTDNLAPVDLRRRNTGRPIFCLPTTTSSITQPQIRVLSSPEHLYSIYDRRSDPFFQSAFDELDFFFSAGGNEALLLLVPAGNGEKDPSAVEDFDLVGRMIGRPGNFRGHEGLYLLRAHERIADTLIFPFLARTVSLEAYRGFLLQLTDFLREDGRYFAIVDSAASESGTDRLLKDLNCHLMAMVEGEIRIQDGPGRFVSPSTFAAVSIQQSDAQRGCENSPTNFKLAVKGYMLKEYTDEEIAGRLEKRLTVVREFSPEDWRWWGSRTLDKSQEPSQYISCVRYIQSLKETLEDILSPYVWDIASPKQCSGIEHVLKEFFQKYSDQRPGGNNVDLPPKPNCSVNLKSTPGSDSVLHVDVEVYLTIPMTWMDVQLSYEG